MTPEFSNIEFFSDAQGGVMLRDDNGVRTFREEETELTAWLFRIIEEDYPEAFRALSEHYAKSRPNARYFMYRVVHRFLRCNFSRLDRKLDIDEFGRFQFEEIDCPLAGECSGWNVICHPKRETKLTARQREVMKLACAGKTNQEIAEMLYIAVDTVATTRKNALRRVGARDLADFMRMNPEFLTDK